MTGKAGGCSCSDWVTRDCRPYAGSRGMARAWLLPIRERRLRPSERCVPSFPSCARGSDLSTTRSWKAWTRSLRVRALRFANRSLRAARGRGVEVVGDIELFGREVARAAPGVRVLAVTGTNGKSTVTALAAAMGGACGMRAEAIGNIGVPVLDALTQAEVAGFADLYAVELSSYQLETTASLALDAAAMLNVSQDHLDRYDGLADYARAKARDLPAVTAPGCSTATTPGAAAWPPGRTFTFGLDVPAGASGMGPRRRRARAHARRAPHPRGRRHAACRGCTTSPTRWPPHALATRRRPAARRPRPGAARVPRACRTACSRSPRRAACASTTIPRAPTSAPRSPRSRASRSRVVLIAGGDGKGQDFAPLAARGARRMRAPSLLIGRDAPRSPRALGRHRRRRSSAPRRWRQAVERAVRLRPPRRRGAAVARLRELRHVPQLRAARRGLRRGRARAARRPASLLMLYSPAPARRRTTTARSLWSALLLGAIGLVMVYSASIAIAEASRFTGDSPAYFLVRHAVFLAVGIAAGGGGRVPVPVRLWQQRRAVALRRSASLLLVAGAGARASGAR